MMVHKFKQALEDAQKAIKIDNTFVKGYLREVKCHILLGDVSSAQRTLANVKKLDSKMALEDETKSIKELDKHFQDATKYYAKKEYRSTLYHVDRAISIATECVRLRVLKAECLALLSRHTEAQEITNDILRVDSMNVDALYVRGLSLYYQDNVEKAFTHFQQALRYSPDHTKAKEIFKRAKLLMNKKQEGNEAFKNNDIQSAYDIYTSALMIDPMNTLTNAKLYFNRAVVNARRSNTKEAIDDCTNAIKLDPNYTKAYLKRAKLYMDSEQYDEAVRDYDHVYKKDKAREHKQLLDNAKLELKKSKRKDYYKILGVEKNVGDDDIKKAYRKRAMLHHPDRHSNASEDVKKEQEKKFKELGEAYAVLSDPKKRQRYDSGVDLDSNGMEYDIDPNNIFEAFFGGGGGNGNFRNANFSFQSGHHGHGGPGFSFTSFPFNM